MALKTAEGTVFGVDTGAHPWKLSREECLFPLLRRDICNAADIGVDDLFYTRKLRALARGEVYAADVLFPEERTVREGITCVRRLAGIPGGSLDCALLMDVLEHIEDDAAFLREAAEKIKPGGTALVTVPAFQFLFSRHDSMSHHFRRYNRKALLALLARTPLAVRSCHYFYTSLFAVRALSMLAGERFAGNDSAWKFPARHPLTLLYKGALNADFGVNRLLSKAGLHLPGLSLLALCVKEG